MITQTAVSPSKNGSTQKSVDAPLTQVYQTRDYDKFSPLHGNRTKNIVHIKRLTDSFARNPLVSIVIVNEMFQVIDGQHRIEVARELGLPIYYIVIKNYGLKEVQIFNSNNSVWNKKAYLESYCQLGLRPYLEFRRFSQMFPEFPIMLCGQLLTDRARINKEASSINGRYATKDFEEGKMVIKDFDLAVKYGRRIMDFRNHYKGYLRKSFVTALIQVFKNKNYNHDRMMKCLNKKFSPKLSDLSNSSLYVVLLEEIYNHVEKKKLSLKYNG